MREERKREKKTYDGDEFRGFGGVLGASRHGIPERHGGLPRD